MTNANDLPTYAEMQRRALSHLSDALAELRSDWRPGNGPDDEQGNARVRAVRAIADAKVLLRGGEPEARAPEPPAELAPLMEQRAQSWHSPDRTRDSARTIEEAVRVLNYATGNYADAGLVWPSTLSDVFGSLRVAASYLDQMIRQSAAWLEEEHQAGRIRVTGGRYVDDPLAAMIEATAALDGARAAAVDLAQAFSDAQNAAAQMAATE